MIVGIESSNSTAMITENISINEENLSGDAKEFATFMRYFCTRMVQSVVQARMGKLVSHPCHPSPEHTDWFNIALDEIGEVAACRENLTR